MVQQVVILFFKAYDVIALQDVLFGLLSVIVVGQIFLVHLFVAPGSSQFTRHHPQHFEIQSLL